MAPRRPRILIAGGSLAGLLSGVLCQRLGYRVSILERSGVDLDGRGAGIVIHGPLFEALAAAGIDAERVPSILCEGRQVLAADGSVVAAYAMHQRSSAWGSLYRLLRSRFPAADYHLGQSVTAVQLSTHGVEVTTHGNQTWQADWLIAADGARSTLREYVPGFGGPRYAGYVAWRGLVPEVQLDTATRHSLGGRMSFALPTGEHILCYEVAGHDDDVRPGRRWYNWVWYRGAAPGTVLDNLLTDTSGRCQRDAIAPDAIRPQVVAAMRSAAAGCLPAAFCRVIEATEQPFLQVIQDSTSRALVHGRLVVVGDAAFTARPHVGLGVSKAAGDALGLVRALTSADTATALALWERERLSFGHAAVDWGRRLGSAIGSPEIAARNQKYRDPWVVMEQVASSHPESHLADANSLAD